MRTVFNNSEVAHVWASQQQASGKSGNIFFEGVSIYSYGYHFEMARFVRPDVVFLTTRGYSNTTAKHLSQARRAVSHLTTFTVPDFDDHAANLAYFITEASKRIDEAKRARSVYKIESVLEHFDTGHIRHYAELFGLNLPELPAISSELRQSLNEKLNVYRVKEHDANVKRQAEFQQSQDIRAREEVAELEAWKRGDGTGSRWFNFASTALRVNGSDVETTHGARVPLEAARQFYRALRADVNLVGQTVGLYAVQSVTDDLVTIGCHRIPMSEIRRIEAEVMQAELASA